MMRTARSRGKARDPRRPHANLRRAKTGTPRMALVVIEHDPNESSARLGQTLRDHGLILRTIHPYHGHPLPPDLDDVEGIISMGGPMNVDQTDDHPWLLDELAYLRAAHEAHIPVVGICLGAQLIAAALGGKVAAMPQPEVGWHPIQITFAANNDAILTGLPNTTMQFHLHSQEVTELPPDAVTLASSSLCKNQAFVVGLTTYAFQYHFEWTLADLQAVIQSAIAPQHADPAALHAQTQRYYHLYRHLGDRLARNITEFLFPPMKNLPHKLGPLTTFDPFTASESHAPEDIPS